MHPANRRLVILAAPALALLLAGESVPRPARATPTPTTPASRILDAGQWSDVHLRRAVYAWSTEDTLTALTHLEAAAALRPTDFENRDRVLYLLAQARHDLGAYTAFVDSTGTGGEAPSPLLERLGFEQLLALHRGMDPHLTLPPTPRQREARLLAADLLLRGENATQALRLLDGMDEHDAVALTLRARAERAAGIDDEATLRRIADLDRDETSGLLIDAACIRLATRAAAGSGDPRPWLERVPDSSRLFARARHMLGSHRVAHGDPDGGRRILEDVLHHQPDYAGRRDVAATLGGLALETGRFEDAYALFARAHAGWEEADSLLARMQEDSRPEELWERWEAPRWTRDAIPLDAESVRSQSDRLVRTVLDLRHHCDVDALSLPPTAAEADAAAETYDPLEPLLQLNAAERGIDRALATKIDDVRYALRRSRFQEQQLEEELARRRRYRATGIAAVAESRRELAAASADLDSLLATLTTILGRLRGVRDEEITRIAARTRALLTRAQSHRDALASLRHFYLDGPMGPRLADVPESVPTPAALLAEERILIGALERFASTFAERAPVLVMRSSQEIWEPRLLGSAPDLADRAHRGRMRAEELTAVLDSSAAVTTTPELERARLCSAELSAQIDSLARQRATTRAKIAENVLARARDTLAREREGLDYGLAAASYELSVAAGASPDAETSSPEVLARRDAAIARLGAFLERYPQSPARGETRFRLADLLLLKARDDFHRQMARFLRAQQDGAATKTVVPFVDTEPALALYRAILAEDLDFPHRDATLFHLGMILADAADPQAEVYLQQLIHEHPDAPFVQRAQLRLADRRFEAKDFDGCVPYYESAARGDDPQVRAIALYKLGWSHFSSDRFERAADAFRRLLDLYQEGAAVDAKIELADEAHDDLVHALARAGGAQAFTRYFDRIGPRPYETEILHGMAQLMRRYSLYEESSEVDALLLRRYPTEPRALDAARRLIDTYERGFDADRALQARLATAPLFLEGSAWYAANASDSLRSEGAEFARKSYRTVALATHRAARESHDVAAWPRALELYDALLRLWPRDGEAPRFHYLAAECAQQLDDPALALRHYTAAAASDTATFRRDAAWQRVAVCDLWYEQSREASPSPSLGADSLAVQLLDVGSEVLAQYPGDTRAADLLWREGNLAFAHGWYDRAAALLGDFVAGHGSDSRAPRAAQLHAETYYRQQHYEAAGQAFEDALALATAADADSLANVLTPLIPHCYFKHAEAMADADTSGAAAPLFAQVAARWPSFEHADLALYRAGLEYAAAGQPQAAADRWESLLRDHPQSEYAMDSYRQIAQTWKQHGDPAAAARAYERYSQAYPKEPDAADALLEAADLRAAAGDSTGARRVQSRYLERFPQDVETALRIRGQRAIEELDQVDEATPVSSLLTGTSAASSELATYLQLCQQHPDRASPSILARVRFLEGEEAFAHYQQIALHQPLEESLEAKKAGLATVLERYGECAGQAVSPWAQAAAYRIGEALVQFGDALVASERPPDLEGDDLQAYEEVLEERSWEFYDRGEQAWNELLRQGDGDGEAAVWIERTQSALYPRMAQRFMHIPVLEYPVVAADGPSR